MIEPVWLDAEDVIVMNEAILEGTPENHLLRSRELLEGAIMRPQSQFEYNSVDNIVVLAVHLIEAIGKAHAFEQGNKRTAWAAARIFLYNNGYQVRRRSKKLQRVIDKMLAMRVENLIEGGDSFDRLVDLLDRMVEPHGE